MKYSMDDIPEIHDPAFDLKSYINNKHPTYNTSIIKTSLLRLQHIRKNNYKELLSMFDMSTINFDLIKQMDKLNIKLKRIPLNSSEKEKMFIKEPPKEFYSSLNIKKFKDSLKKFQENLDVFITESRRLEFEGLCFFFKQLSKNEEEVICYEDLNFQEGTIILTNDIVFIGRRETNGYLLVDSFLYDILHKSIIKENISIKNIKSIKTPSNRLYSILLIKSPTSNIYILMETQEILNVLTVFEKCIFKKIKTNKKKFKKKFQKITYLLETEQYEEIQKIIERNRNKETIYIKKKFNTEPKGKAANLIQNTTLNKIIKSLNHKSNTYEDLYILLQIVDPIKYLTSIYKQNFPPYEIDNFIEKYFKYFKKFLEEANNILIETRKKFKEMEIVEINLLLREKVTKIIIKKCIKQILWRGRKTNEVDLLLKELREKTDLKYLLNKYDAKINKWKDSRKKFIKYKLKEVGEEIVRGLENIE